MKTKNILSIFVILLMLTNIVSTASAYEVRGTVSDGTLKAWDTKNFAGFYYDINNDLGAETLTITDTDLSDRVISENKLIYTTGMVPVTFEYSKNKAKPVYDAVTQYQVVGWQAEKWVALNGKANKLVKIIKEFKKDDKVTLITGSTLDLGKGYMLKINAIDARTSPRQAWIQIIKDGKTMDEGVLQQDSIYNLKKTVGGEESSLIFSAYVSSIFSGTDKDMIQLQYVWLIDESSFTEIKTSDKFGIFEVTATTPITLSNDGTVSLSKNSDVTLMGNMKLKIADSNTLRFYPYVSIIDNENIVIPASSTTVSNAVIVSTPTPCNITERIVEKVREVPVEKIVYVTVTPTTTPVPPLPIITPSLPGFEGLIAIVGLIVVAFFISRQKK